MGSKKKKILQLLLRRWLRSNINGLCILTIFTIFLYLIYFVCFYLVFIKRNVEIGTENRDVFVGNATRYFPVSFPSEDVKTSYNLSDRDSIRKYLNTILRDGLRRERDSICEPPVIEVEEEQKIEEKEEEDTSVQIIVPKLVCSTLDWVKCYKSECKVVKDILDTTDNITCKYRDVFYYVNGGWRFGNWTTVSNNGTYVLKGSDYVSVDCVGHNLDGLFETSWYGRQVGIRNKTIKDEGNQNGSLNILLLGFGCGSSNEFMTKLPKTYKVLTKNLNATVLDGFTSVGVDFISSLFPILTGRNELDSVDLRKRMSKSYKMPSRWFIFSTLEEIGYSTAFYEDFPLSFSRFHGFYSWPAHHYNHPFLMHIYSRNKRPCLGDASVYEIFMNLTHQFMYSSPKTFAFTFISSACGENAVNVDDAAQKLLESLEGENTMVIVVGTKGGSPKQNNKIPPFAAIIPPLKFNPDFQTALQANAKAVTTPYDIHETLLDAVGLTEYWSKIKVEGSKYVRALSILRPIPLNRKCSDAGVLPEWCTCLLYEYVTKTDNLYMTLAHAFVYYVNTLTAPVRTRCKPLFLHSINWMKKQRVNMKLVTYDGSVDKDGYIARFNPRIRNPQDLYKMQLVLNPPGAIFEASVFYLNLNGSIIFDEKNIVRIDDNKTYCLLPTHPQLIKYCYCK